MKPQVARIRAAISRQSQTRSPSYLSPECCYNLSERVAWYHRVKQGISFRASYYFLNVIRSKESDRAVWLSSNAYILAKQALVAKTRCWLEPIYAFSALETFTATSINQPQTLEAMGQQTLLYIDLPDTRNLSIDPGSGGHARHLLNSLTALYVVQFFEAS